MENEPRTPPPAKQGLNFTGLGTEVTKTRLRTPKTPSPLKVEAILAGVLAYLVIGAGMLVFCCVMSKVWIWNRRRLLRKKRAAEGLDDAYLAYHGQEDPDFAQVHSASCHGPGEGHQKGMQSSLSPSWESGSRLDECGDGEGFTSFYSTSSPSY